MNRTVGRALTLTAAGFWGTSFVIIRWGLIYLPAMEFLFFRFFLSFIIIFVIIFINDSFDGFREAMFSKEIMLAGILNSLGYTFQFLGQQYTKATNASILINLSGVFVAIIAHYYLKEKLNYIGAAGIIIAFFGASLLITKGELINIFTYNLIGDLLCLLSGLSWALYIVKSKEITVKGFTDEQLLAIWFLYVTIFSFPLMLLQGFKAINISGWIAITYTSLTCTILAFLFWYKGLKILEATTSSIYFIIEIAISAILESIIFGLNFTSLEIIGAVFAVSGVFLTDFSFSSRNNQYT